MDIEVGVSHMLRCQEDRAGGSCIVLRHRVSPQRGKAVFALNVNCALAPAFTQQKCVKLLTMKPVGSLVEAARAFGLLTSNDSSLAACKGAGDTIQAKGSHSEGR